MQIGNRSVVEASHVEQLDILRGFAILLMVVNHAGVALLTPELQARPVVAAFIFLGSFAPVIFFFTTGFGIGIARSSVSGRDFLSTLFKAFLLFVADQFLFWSHGGRYGLDFLSFIAISTVVVTAVAADRHPLRLSCALTAISFLLRYALGPRLSSLLPLNAAANWTIGVGGVDGVSYPLSPWIIYPLLGFLIARLYQAGGRSLAPLAWRWPGVVGLAAIPIAVALYLGGAVFFRWGTVSLGYFVLSLGALYVSMAAMWVFHATWPRAGNLLALRGIASLAVVPIHYALIEVLISLGRVPQSLLAAAVTLVALVALTISLATAFARLIRRFMSISTNVVTHTALAMLVLFCAMLIWLGNPSSSAIFACAAIGQLGIAGLLATRRSPPRRVVATR